MVDRIDDYRRMAAGGIDLRGLTVLAYANEIGALIQQHGPGPLQLLDYGCGAGDAYRPPHEVHKRWGVPRPIPYDPAFPKYARPVTGTFDGVLCIDVLEHLSDEAQAREVIAELFSRADSFVFASVCCRPAKKTFPDGTNLHTLVRPFSWWQERFHEAELVAEWVLKETP